MNLNPRAVLLANAIIAGTLNYTVAVTARPDLKDDIDTHLTATGNGHLIGT